MTENPGQIVVYGAMWCGDCRRAKRFLETHRVPHQWVSVEDNPEAIRYVMDVNQGLRSIPTIVFPDGSVLVEPSNADLAARLGLEA